MGLLDRFSTLLRADAHGMIDALEDRSLVLRQTLREAESELVRKRARLELLDAETTDLDSERTKLQKEETALDHDTELALEREETDLARHAARRLLAARRARAACQERLRTKRREREDLAERLGEQEQRFEEMERRIRARLAVESQESDAPDRPPTWAISDEEVEIELLRRREAGTGGRP